MPKNSLEQTISLTKFLQLLFLIPVLHPSYLIPAVGTMAQNSSSPIENTTTMTRSQQVEAGISGAVLVDATAMANDAAAAGESLNTRHINDMYVSQRLEGILQGPEAIIHTSDIY